MSRFSGNKKLQELAVSAQNDRLAFFIPDLRPGGAERVLLILCNALADAGFHVDLLLARNSGEFFHLLSPKVRVIALAQTRTVACAPGIAKYLRSARPSVLTAFLAHASAAAYLGKLFSGTKIPFIASLRNQLSMETGDSKSRIDKVTDWLLKQALRKAEGVVAVSQGVADDVEASVGLPVGAVKVIYNPVVGEEIFSRAQAEPEHPWLSDAAIPVFVAVGRLGIQKDHKTLIDAFSIVAKSRECRLLIFGEGDLREPLELQIKQLGLDTLVAMPGFTDNPFCNMARAHTLVLSSRYEGLPGVLIQAIALGRPVVATDCLSGPSEVLQGGKFGRLVPVGDAPALAQAMLASLETPIFPPEESWAPYIEESQALAWAEYLLQIAHPHGRPQ